MGLPVMPAHSKRSVRQVSTVDNCTAPSMPATLNGCMATTRLQPIKKRCASARSGWNPYLLRPKTGMACGASACGCSGVSTWGPYGLPQGKISSGCSKSGDGDDARSQRRPCAPLFGCFGHGVHLLGEEGLLFCRVVEVLQGLKVVPLSLLMSFGEDFFNRLVQSRAKEPRVSDVRINGLHTTLAS